MKRTRTEESGSPGPSRRRSTDSPATKRAPTGEDRSKEKPAKVHKRNGSEEQIPSRPKSCDSSSSDKRAASRGERRLPSSESGKNGRSKSRNEESALSDEEKKQENRPKTPGKVQKRRIVRIVGTRVVVLFKKNFTFFSCYMLEGFRKHTDGAAERSQDPTVYRMDDRTYKCILQGTKDKQVWLFQQDIAEFKKHCEVFYDEMQNQKNNPTPLSSSVEPSEETNSGSNSMSKTKSTPIVRHEVAPIQRKNRPASTEKEEDNETKERKEKEKEEEIKIMLEELNHDDNPDAAAEMQMKLNSRLTHLRNRMRVRNKMVEDSGETSEVVELSDSEEHELTRTESDSEDDYEVGDIVEDSSLEDEEPERNESGEGERGEEEEERALKETAHTERSVKDLEENVEDPEVTELGSKERVDVTEIIEGEKEEEMRSMKAIEEAERREGDETTARGEGIITGDEEEAVIREKIGLKEGVRIVEDGGKGEGTTVGVTGDGERREVATVGLDNAVRDSVGGEVGSEEAGEELGVREDGEEKVDYIKRGGDAVETGGEERKEERDESSGDDDDIKIIEMNEEGEEEEGREDVSGGEDSEEDRGRRGPMDERYGERNWNEDEEMESGEGREDYGERKRCVRRKRRTGRREGREEEWITSKEGGQEYSSSSESEREEQNYDDYDPEYQWRFKARGGSPSPVYSPVELSEIESTDGEKEEDGNEERNVSTRFISTDWMNGLRMASDAVLHRGVQGSKLVVDLRSGEATVEGQYGRESGFTKLKELRFSVRNNASFRVSFKKGEGPVNVDMDTKLRKGRSHCEPDFSLANAMIDGQTTELDVNGEFMRHKILECESPERDDFDPYHRDNDYRREPRVEGWKCKRDRRRREQREKWGEWEEVRMSEQEYEEKNKKEHSFNKALYEKWLKGKEEEREEHSDEALLALAAQMEKIVEEREEERKTKKYRRKRAAEERTKKRLWMEREEMYGRDRRHRQEKEKKKEENVPHVIVLD